jgi:hypothetical protein
MEPRLIEQLAAPVPAVGGVVEMSLDANMVGVGVLTAQRDSASVMVCMNRTVTDKSGQPDGSPWRVDDEKSDGKWLINDIRPI